MFPVFLSFLFTFPAEGPRATPRISLRIIVALRYGHSAHTSDALVRLKVYTNMFACFINDLCFHWNMPKGLKETSSPLVISFSLIETAIDTFTSDRIDLQLNALDNEVFVITGAKMDLSAPTFGIPSNDRFGVFASLSKQDITQSTNRNLGNPSIFATANVQLFTDADAGSNVVSTVQENDMDTPQAMEYLDIIATPDFFVNINGFNQTARASVDGKLYGYRARADAATYAALVQSELLSQ